MAVRKTQAIAESGNNLVIGIVPCYGARRGWGVGGLRGHAVRVYVWDPHVIINIVIFIMM